MTFNRNAPNVVRSAAFLSCEDFIEKFKDQTTETALKRIYASLRSQIEKKALDTKVKKKINSRTPLSSTGHPIEIDSNSIKEIATDNEKIYKGKEKIDEIEKEVERIGLSEEGKKSLIKIKKNPITNYQKKIVAENIGNVRSKRELIYLVLEDNPNVPNRDIKWTFKQQGIKVYDSEILAAKRKFNNK